MRSLLLSGLGVTYKNSTYFDESLFGSELTPKADAMLVRSGLPTTWLHDLGFEDSGAQRPLLRPPDIPPHLTTFTLESILQDADEDYCRVELEDVWNDVARPPDRDVDVVLLSTTFIWNRQMLGKVMTWLREKVPGVPVVAGGQYTNLKFAVIMDEYPEITDIVRGDAEVALPMLLKIQRHGGDRAAVPNLVWRDGTRMRVNKADYIDLDDFSSPTFPGNFEIAPYESMRGCPFDCKFCSFPAASPKWRYKSAEKIKNDWERYRKVNGASAIEAMDSTFTVPPTRLRRLMEILPGSEIPEWSCYTRANVIKNSEFVDRLLESYCNYLVIGFESMNDETLRRMSKRVSSTQNRRAFELLRGSEMGYTNCFIVGYPGENPNQFGDTQRFLLDEYEGHFMLHMFSVTDETMPLWEDREALQIEVDDPYDPASPWSHIGMTSSEATRLQAETLDQVRMSNDSAVTFLWQRDYQEPLIPTKSAAANLAVEKAVERLAMAPRDFENVDGGAQQILRQVENLRELGVHVRGRTEDSRMQL